MLSVQTHNLFPDCFIRPEPTKKSAVKSGFRRQNKGKSAKWIELKMQTILPWSEDEESDGDGTSFKIRKVPTNGLVSTSGVARTSPRETKTNNKLKSKLVADTLGLAAKLVSSDILFWSSKIWARKANQARETVHLVGKKEKSGQRFGESQMGSVWRGLKMHEFQNDRCSEIGFNNKPEVAGGECETRLKSATRERERERERHKKGI
jgi:hypothetical protein